MLKYYFRSLLIKGNVILTDYQYTILSLLRVHKFDEDAKCAVREKYPFTQSAGMTVDTIMVDPLEITKIIEGKDEEQIQSEKKEGEDKLNED